MINRPFSKDMCYPSRKMTRRKKKDGGSILLEGAAHNVRRLSCANSVFKFLKNNN